MNLTRLSKAAILLSLIWLTACGGGGGGGSDSSSVAQAMGSASNDSATTSEDSPVLIDVLANDTSVTANGLTALSATNGTTEVINGQVRYTPDANFHGIDNFNYTAIGTDGISITGNVSVTVSSVNDAPIANDDIISIVENTPTRLSVADNDNDIDGTLTTIVLTSLPANGTLQVDGLDLNFVPDEDFIGSDSFTYQIQDNNAASSQLATVTLNIEPITDTDVSVVTLAIPTTNYSQLNNPEINATVLTSTRQSFEIPPNTVSFTLSLQDQTRHRLCHLCVR